MSRTGRPATGSYITIIRRQVLDTLPVLIPILDKQRLLVSLAEAKAQTDAKAFKKYFPMKLQMKREALAKLNRQANEKECA